MIILYCLRSSLPRQFIKPSEEGFPVDQLKPGRHEREDQGVLPQQWSEVRGGREKPLRSTVSMKDPNQGAYVITGYEVARFVCLDLVDYADAAESFFYGNDVSAMVATTRRECHLVKTRFVIRASYYFLPLIRGDLKGDRGVFL